MDRHTIQRRAFKSGGMGIVDSTILEIRSPPSPIIPVQPLTSLFVGTFSVLEGSSFVSVPLRATAFGSNLGSKGHCPFPDRSSAPRRKRQCEPNRRDIRRTGALGISLVVSKSTTLPRLGSWVRIPSPAPDCPTLFGSCVIMAIDTFQSLGLGKLGGSSLRVFTGSELSPGARVPTPLGERPHHDRSPHRHPESPPVHS